MSCSRCGTEVPDGSRFCLKCGMPVGGAAAAPGGGRLPRWAIPAAIALLVLAAVGYLAWSNLAGRGSKVAEAPAVAPPAGPLTDRSARVAPTAPLTDAPAARAEPPRADIMDYLKFLQQIEGERVTLTKTQTGQVLEWSSRITASNLQGEMSEDPTSVHRATYTEFQNALASWQAAWQQLSGRFIDGYGKPVPPECTQLRDLYHEVMKLTAGSITQVGTALAEGLSGNSQGALEQLSKMRGSASADVDRACAGADTELAGVCDRFRLRKEFAIKSEGGMANPFGAGL